MDQCTCDLNYKCKRNMSSTCSFFLESLINVNVFSFIYELTVNVWIVWRMVEGGFFFKCLLYIVNLFSYLPKIETKYQMSWSHFKESSRLSRRFIHIWFRGRNLIHACKWLGSPEMQIILAKNITYLVFVNHWKKPTEHIDSRHISILHHIAWFWV